MGKIVKIIIALAFVLIAAFIVRTIYFHIAGISVEELVDNAKNQAEQVVNESLKQAEKTVEKSFLLFAETLLVPFLLIP